MRNSLLGDVCGHDALSAAGGRWPERLLRMSFLRFRDVWGLGFRGLGVWGFGCRVSGFRVWGLVFQSLGFRALGVRGFPDTVISVFRRVCLAGSGGDCAEIHSA